MQTKQTTGYKTVISLAVIVGIGALLIIGGMLDNDVFSTEYQAQKWVYSIGVTVLVVALAGVCLRELFRPASARPAEPKRWFYPLMAGVLTLGVMALAYTFLGMWPLGNESAMIVDMHHQYGPMLAKLRDMFTEGGNVLYSFDVGMGNSFLPMFGYYLASPFNLLLVLFPDHLLTEGILVITLLKNTLSAVAFAACMQYIYGKRTAAIPVVSVLYATMMYVLAYSWNLMWLDALVVLPLVILGFEYLMRTGKFLPYVLSLAYLIFANYYIGFMVCIFLVLYYIAFTLRHPKGTVDLCRGFLRFAIGSALAGGLTAALVLPVFLGLGHTSAAGGGLYETMKENFSLFDFFGQHLYGIKPTIRSGNLPNVACGILTVVALPLFAVLKKIPLRRRLAYLGLWLTMTLSMVINQPDLLWHGLHSPNDLPYRYSFLYSFVLLLIAYEVLLHIKEIPLRHVAITAAGLAGYLILEQKFGTREFGFAAIFGSLLLVGVYTAVMALAASRTVRVRTAYCLLLMAVTAEAVIGSGGTLVKLNGQEYYTDHYSYVDNDVTKAVDFAVDKAQDIADAAVRNDGFGDFYRMEVLPRRTLVDTAMFGYRGITLFSSSNYYTTTRLMNALGFAANGVNSHAYKSFIPSVDSLLGIRYLVIDAHLGNHAQLRELDSAGYGYSTYYIYENKDALPLAYMGTDALRTWQFSYYNPFTTQNTLYAALTGDGRSVLELQPVQVSEWCDIATVPGSTPSYFSIAPTDSEKTATFHVDVEQAGQAFLYVDCRAASSITVSSDNGSWSVTPHEPFMIDGGHMNVGDTVTVRVTADNYASGNVYVGIMNDEVYRDAMAKLSEGGLKVTSFRDSHIEGTVNAPQSGVMMTTIPYDAGWKVKVDGKEVETFGVAEALLAFSMDSGEHTVELTFVPDGLWLGIGATAFSLIALVLLVLWTRRRPPLDATGAEVLCDLDDPDEDDWCEILSEEPTEEEPPMMPPAEMPAPTETATPAAEESTASEVPLEQPEQAAEQPSEELPASPTIEEEPLEIDGFWKPSQDEKE